MIPGISVVLVGRSIPPFHSVDKLFWKRLIATKDVVSGIFLNVPLL